MNNTFSFSRFGMVLKRDLVENRKRYLGVFFIMFIAFLAYQLADMKDIIELSLIRTYEQGDYMASLATDCLPCFYGVLVLALMCAAADMTAVPLRSKTIATNYLMMPASNLEKFLSRTLINTVMVIIMAYVALFCADLVRMLCVPLFDLKEFYGFTVPRALVAWAEPLKEIFSNGGVGFTVVNGVELRPEWEMSMAIMSVAFSVLLALYWHSQFILGGCIWRKRALLKMFLIGLVLMLIFAWMLAEIIPSIETWLEHSVEPWLETTLSDMTQAQINRIIFSIGIPFCLAFTIFNWWLSYHLFTRKQVIVRGFSLKKLLNKARS